jgi:hypothetical protein
MRAVAAVEGQAARREQAAKGPLRSGQPQLEILAENLALPARLIRQSKKMSEYTA